MQNIWIVINLKSETNYVVVMVFIQVRKVHCCLPISSVLKSIIQTMHVGGTLCDLVKDSDNIPS